MNQIQLVALFESLLKKQDDMNVLSAGSSYLTRSDVDFNRALRMEACELIDGHIHWKWWKAPNAKENAFQAKLELVDIFHFVLSRSLATCYHRQSLDGIATDMAKTYTWFSSSNTMVRGQLELTETLIQLSFNSDYTNYDPNLELAFWSLCDAFDLSLEDLARMYQQKWALNRFRQLNDYKVPGAYDKFWNLESRPEPVEDNAALEWLVTHSRMDSTVAGYSESLIQGLTELYTRHKELKNAA